MSLDAIIAAGGGMANTGQRCKNTPELRLLIGELQNSTTDLKKLFRNPDYEKLFIQIPPYVWAGLINKRGTFLKEILDKMPKDEDITNAFLKELLDAMPENIDKEFWIKLINRYPLHFTIIYGHVPSNLSTDAELFGNILREKPVLINSLITLRYTSDQFIRTLIKNNFLLFDIVSKNEIKRRYFEIDIYTIQCRINYLIMDMHLYNICKKYKQPCGSFNWFFTRKIFDFLGVKDIKGLPFSCIKMLTKYSGELRRCTCPRSRCRFIRAQQHCDYKTCINYDIPEDLSIEEKKIIANRIATWRKEIFSYYPFFKIFRETWYG